MQNSAHPQANDSSSVRGDGDGYLTPTDVAGRLAVSTGTLANWRSQGLGPPYIKLADERSGRVRYALRDLQVWESSRAGVR